MKNNYDVGFFDDIEVAKRTISSARMQYMPFTNEQEVNYGS